MLMENDSYKEAYYLIKLMKSNFFFKCPSKKNPKNAWIKTRFRVCYFVTHPETYIFTSREANKYS